MKTIVLLSLSLLTGFSGLAQGFFNFSNGAAGVNAPVHDTDGTNSLSGPGFQAILYFAPGTNALEATLTPVNNTQTGFASGLSAGFFFGGTKSIAGTSPGDVVSAQVRAWRLSDGATWEIASATGKAGKGNIVSVKLAASNGAIPNLVGITSFNLMQVPEPSTIALALLGGSLLLFRRRK
jgi:hypothetical protein